MKRLSLQSAYVLHTRPYRETSLLVNLFTLDYGRVDLIARGVRKGKSVGLLQPFIPLLISAVGKQDLLTLQQVEAAESESRYLQGKALFSAYYTNELLMRLLQPYDAYPGLFTMYQTTVQQLTAGQLAIDVVLRQFEWRLLQELGYALGFTHDADSKQPIVADGDYRYQIGHGFTIDNAKTNVNSLFSGKDLLAIAQGDLTTPQTRRVAKQIMRVTFAQLLGHKPLKSRELFCNYSSCE